jgi:hypothetical protein
MRTVRVKNTSAILIVLLLSGLAAVSGWAQTAAPATTLTPEERESALKSFQATRDNFLNRSPGLSPKQWTFKPAPDRWSVAEVSEHIAVSESTLLA